MSSIWPRQRLSCLRTIPRTLPGCAFSRRAPKCRLRAIQTSARRLSWRARARVFGMGLDRRNMVFEEIAGLVRMTIDTDAGVVTGAALAAPQQLRIIRDFDAATIAKACSLDAADIETRRHSPCLASCGAPFVVAEVRDRAALRRAQPRMDVFLAHLPRDEATGVHLYVEDADEGADFQSRMFAPLHGVFEDPATGSANVALIGLLAHLRPELSLRLEAAIGQGVDLGRPSRMRAVAEKENGVVTRHFHWRRLQAGDVRFNRPASRAILIRGAALPYNGMARRLVREEGKVSRSHSANLFDLVAARAPNPEKLALETADATSLTYGELFARSAQAAHALVALGVKPGDRVAAQIEKSTDVVVVALACFRAGAVLLPLNTAYTLAELEYFLGDAEPALILCRPEQLEPVRALALKLGLPRVESLGVEARWNLRRENRRRAGCVRDGPARKRRSGGDPLHLGHDRPLERGDADARESDVERADACRVLALRSRGQAHSRAAGFSYPWAVRGDQCRAHRGGDDDLHEQVRSGRGDRGDAGGDVDDGGADLLHPPPRPSRPRSRGLRQHASLRLRARRRCSPRRITPGASGPASRSSSATA